MLSNMASRVIEHWRENFPLATALLEKQGTLESWAEHKADQTATSISHGMARGASYPEAEEASRELWGQPPTLNERFHPDPEA